MVLKLVRVKGKEIYLLGVVKGLTIERKTVRKAFNKIKPDAIALYVSEPELLGLQNVLDGKTKQVPLSRYEVIYARKLAHYALFDKDKYGEVQVPPPPLMEALELGLKKKRPVVALDMPEQIYQNEYIKNISTTQLLRHSMRIKKLRKKKFNVKTPEEFTLAWDNELTKLKGFKRLEDARERHMAKRIIELKNKFDTLLAILELERIEGVLNYIKSEGKTE